jgi:hypothetical protein
MRRLVPEMWFIPDRVAVAPRSSRGQRSLRLKTSAIARLLRRFWNDLRVIALRQNLPPDMEFHAQVGTVNHTAIHVETSFAHTAEPVPARAQIAGFELATSAPASMLPA